MKLYIYCEEDDFSALSEAFDKETESDLNLSAEIVITDGDEIRRLNRELRGIDAVTDVLSFPSLNLKAGAKLCKKDFPADIDEDGNLFIGSIAICRKRAEEQAEEYGHSLKREMNYLAVHGLCHLLGYDHIEEADKKLMREKEECVLKKIGAVR